MAMIQLIPFCKEHLILLDQWADEINYKNYMSRITPYHYEDYWSQAQNRIAWYVITIKDQKIGSVWLEKDISDSNTATLGILIGKKKWHGKGIGRLAIDKAIMQAREKMEFSVVNLRVRLSNVRAIRCYEKCGFKEKTVGEKTKANGQRIPFITMVKALN